MPKAQPCYLVCKFCRKASPYTTSTLPPHGTLLPCGHDHTLARLHYGLMPRLLKPNKKKLRLYVWDKFSPDHSYGLAFAIASSVDEAKKLIIKKKKT